MATDDIGPDSTGSAAVSPDGGGGSDGVVSPVQAANNRINSSGSSDLIGGT
jgi:hypothetical protein